MILSDLSLRRPKMAIVLNLLIMIFGFMSLMRLPLREYPDVDPPIITVETKYPGASAEIIESKVTQVIENRISGIDGIKSIESITRDGSSRIVIEFNLNRDIDAAANDIRDRVSKVLDDLPDQVEAPEISKTDSNENVMMWFSLVSDQLNELELTDYAERFLVDRLSIVDGVARVNVGSARRYAMRIWLDPEKMVARGVSVMEVEQALQLQNIDLPAGRLEAKHQEISLRLERPYMTVQDYQKLVVRSDGDLLVRLGDIARVERDAADTRSEYRGNGQPMVGLGIVKQVQANTIAVARGIHREVEKIRKSLPQTIELKSSYDTSVFVEEAILETFYTLIIAIGLVGLIIFAFLGRLKLTLIPMVTIPISLIASFIFLDALGYSINILTLLSLILAIGLVVDDSIVVLENNCRRMERGEDPLLASFRGTNQVAFAVIVTTISLVAVFLPIMFLEGMTGRIFTEFVASLSFAVLASSFVALTLSPVLTSMRVLVDYKPKTSRFVDCFQSMTRMLEYYYLHFVIGAIRRTKYVVISVIASLAMIIGLYFVIPKEYTPLEDRGSFFVTSDGPEGASFDYMADKMRKLEDRLMFLVNQGWAERVLVRVPRSFSNTDVINNALSIIILKPWNQRPHVSSIMRETMKLADQVEGLNSFPTMNQGLQRRGMQRPIQFVIGGSDYQQLAQWRDIIIERAEKTGLITHINYDYKETKPKILVHIDKDKAATLGVTAMSIGRTLETFLNSRRVTTYFERGEEYDVILQAHDHARRTPEDLQKLYVKSETTDALIPLMSLVHLKEVADSSTLNRYNRIRSITIDANLAPGVSIDQALTMLDHIAAEVLPHDAVVSYKGQSLDFKESKSSNLFVFAIALLVVYLLLAAQFESFIHPFVIMTTVPAAIIGALLGLWVMGDSLNIFSQIGLFILVGMAAKNGILIVEFVNQLRDRNVSVVRAVIRASLIRFRPIVMTSFATVVGAIPLLVSSGAGSETRLTIGIVICFGMFFTTLFTLVSVPVFYLLMARRTSTPLAQERLLEKLKTQSQEEI